jgi:signal transduction histidine kinase
MNLPIATYVGDQQTVRPRRWWRSGLAFAGLAAVIGVSTSLTGAATLAGADREANRQAIEHRVAVAQRAVTEEMRRYVDAIRLVAASAGTHPLLTRDDYLALTQPLLDAKLVGSTGVGFVVAAPDDRVAAVQAQWRARGVPDLQLRPEGSGREHFFTIFNRTLDGTVAAPTGVDISQAAEPVAALAEARRSGAATLSRPYLLLRDRDLTADRRQLSFVLAAPVLAQADAAGTQPFLGWIVTGLRGQNFTAAILHDSTEGLRAATLYAPATDGHELPVAGLTRGPTRRSDLHAESSIPVAQQRWTLHATADSRSAGNLPPWVAIGGSLLTVALTGLVLVLTTARNRAHGQAIRTAARLEADTTSRQIMEAQLRHTRDALAAQQTYLARLLDSLDLVVIACDDEGRVTLENAYARRVGVPATLTHLDGTPLTEDELPLGRTLREGCVDGVEVLYQGPGHRPLTMIIHGRTLLSGDGSRIGAVITGYDITELRDHERELAGFATIAAHDLKAPLAVIAAYTELLSDSSTGDAAELLSRINAGVGRMRALIEDLLAYASARNAALDAVNVDLRKIVADIVTARTDHLRLTAGEQFPDVYVGPLPMVYADAGMVRQLVDNLVGNGLKYVHPGQAARVDITATEEDGWVRVEIADRGIGIPATERDKVFTPFHRAHSEHRYGGTGLGLAICQRIADRHGGRLGVTANPGGGSRFFFTLPAAVTTPDLPARAPLPHPAGWPQPPEPEPSAPEPSAA